MVNHKIRHLQQRFVTTNISIYFEVATGVHLHESLRKPPSSKPSQIKHKPDMRHHKPNSFISKDIYFLDWHVRCQLGTLRVIAHKKGHSILRVKVLQTAPAIPR